MFKAFKKAHPTTKNIAFLLVLFFGVEVTFAQKAVKEYVKTNALEVKTIAIDEEDFSDLESFGNAVGESRIVALGEQNHGDGTTFEAKGRLVRYLHEQKGFNVLVFESDYFGLTYGFEKIAKTKDSINHFLANNIMEIWSSCDKAKPLLYDYIYTTHTTQNPLQIAGMDCQFHGGYTFANLANQASQVFAKIAVSPQDPIDATTIVSNLHHTYYWTRVEPDSGGIQNGLAALNSLLKDKSLDQLTIDEKLLVDNIKRSYEDWMDVLSGKSYLDDNYTKRDRQMFHNVMWLLKHKYPDEKIIIWAHSAHLAKSAVGFEDKNQKGIMLGNFLGDEKINPYSYYVLGFSSYTAKPVWANGNFIVKVEKPLKNGFENWISKDWNYAFLDLKTWNRSKNSGEAFAMKGSNFPSHQHRNLVYQWGKVFDGVFFIRNIEGCEKIDFGDN